MSDKSDIALLFDLLNDEQDDFPYLLKKYRIDPQNELRHADLTGVDFCDLQVKTLDLTGAVLIDANLSRVKCSKLILTDAITAGAKFPKGATDGSAIASNHQEAFSPPAEVALLAIQKFQGADLFADEFVRHLRDSRSPSMAFCGSALEQDVLTRRIIIDFQEEWIALQEERIEQDEHLSLQPFAGFMWLYTRRASARNRFLDADTVSLIRDISIEQPELHRGINPTLVARNQRLVLDLQNRLGPSLPSIEQAHDFVEFLVRHNIRTLLFSGFPPISKRMYDEMRERIGHKFKVIFACPAFVEQQMSDIGAVGRRNIVPRYPFSSERTIDRDGAKLLANRVRTATNGAVIISKLTIDGIFARHDSIPLAKLKGDLAKALGEPRQTAKKGIMV